MIFTINNVRALRGPNLWLRDTVLEIEITLAKNFTALNPENLTAYLAIKNPEGLTFQALAQKKLDLDCYAQSIIFFQQYAENTVSFWRVIQTNDQDVFKIVVAYGDEEVARRALIIAQDFFQSLSENQVYPLLEELTALRDLARSVRLGPSTQAIIDAVKARNIPVMRLNEYNLLQCGYGSRQAKIQAAETDRTSMVAENIAQHKELTKSLFHAVGVPTPRGQRVQNVEEAWQFACAVKMPIVIKPESGHQGKGVAVNLSTREQIQAGFEAAAKLGPVMVETLIPGDDYRLLIVGGQLVAAARREPPAVIGDGKKTIAELVFEINQNPLRGEDHATVLSKLILDDIALGVLAQQGLTVNTILAPKQKAIIRANANLSTGGCAIDVTDLVHPEVAARAIDAAAIVGLDIAGIDVIAQDIARPLEEQNGGIVEANAAPGLRMHLAPTEGQPRPVGEAIANLLFKECDNNGRIPIFAVTGTNGKTTTVRLIAHILREAGFYTGLTCTEGVYANDDCIDLGDCSGPKSARLLLKNSSIDAAVCEVARGGILREGLGFDFCQVAVVTNIGAGDHLGISGIDTSEDLARVKSTIVSAVLPHGAAVLNAADPLVAAMQKVCPAEIIYFAYDPKTPCLVEHLAQGGRGVSVMQDSITFFQGQEVIAHIPLQNIPLTHQGKVKFQVENVCAAAAAMWAFDLNFALLAQGLLTFKGDNADAPGRFNVMYAREAFVILDYGHNLSSLNSIIESLPEFNHVRRCVVYSVAGDRRDSDMVEQGLLLGNEFDQVIIYEDPRIMRGRAEGEIIEKLTEGIKQGMRVKGIHTFACEKDAALYALQQLKPNDLLLLQIDDVFGITQFVQQTLGDSHCG